MIFSQLLTPRFSRGTAVWRFEAVNRLTNQQHCDACCFLAQQLFFLRAQSSGGSTADSVREVLRPFLGLQRHFCSAQLPETRRPWRICSPDWWLQSGRGLRNLTSQHGSKALRHIFIELCWLVGDERRAGEGATATAISRLHCLLGGFQLLFRLIKGLKLPHATNYTQNKNDFLFFFVSEAPSVARHSGGSAAGLDRSLMRQRVYVFRQ